MQKKKLQGEAEFFCWLLERMNNTGSVSELESRYDLALYHIRNHYKRNVKRLIKLGKDI